MTVNLKICSAPKAKLLHTLRISSPGWVAGFLFAFLSCLHNWYLGTIFKRSPTITTTRPHTPIEVSRSSPCIQPLGHPEPSQVSLSSELEARRHKSRPLEGTGAGLSLPQTWYVSRVNHLNYLSISFQAAK